VDGLGSGLCPTGGFGISGFELLAFASTVLVNHESLPKINTYFYCTFNRTVVVTIFHISCAKNNI
jgi:hypothetical protein